MKIINITCDYCGNNINETSNSIDWRILVTSEQIPSRSGIVTDMMIYPPIPKDLNFCGVGCLKQYINSKI